MVWNGLPMVIFALFQILLFFFATALLLGKVWKSYFYNFKNHRSRLLTGVVNAKLSRILGYKVTIYLLAESLTRKQVKLIWSPETLSCIRHSNGVYSW